MTLRPLVFLATSFLVLLGGSTPSASGTPVARRAGCTSLEGTVLGYDPNAFSSCASHTLVGQNLYAGETVRSNGTGDFTFRTAHLSECIQFATPHGTADVLKPKPGVALRHLRGTTWCRHLKTDQKSRTLRTPGAVIHLHGTMFGLATDSRNSTVKVAHGHLNAVSTFDGRVVTIMAGYKAYFPAFGAPSQPRPFKRSSRDVQAFALLSVDAAPMGPQQVAELLQSQKLKAVLLVAPDSSTLSAVKSTLVGEGIQVGAILASQLQASSKTLTNYAGKYHTRTVAVAAPAAGVRPLLDAVHQAAPAGFTIAFIDTT